MPQRGEWVTEGTGDRWNKHEGGFVKRDEPLVEVVTGKVNAESPSPFEGKLVKISAGEGETVRVGAVIGQIEGAGAGTAENPVQEAGVAQTEVPPAPAKQQAPAIPAISAGGDEGNGERAKLSPAVRKLAAEHGIDAASLRGSGMGGRVTRDDVLAAVGSAPAATAAPAAPPARPAPGPAPKPAPPAPTP